MNPRFDSVDAAAEASRIAAEAADVALAKRLELRARTGIEHAPMNSAVAGVLADLETPMTESDIAMLTETIKWHGLETVDPAKRLAQAEIEDRTTAAQLAVREAAHQEHLASSRAAFDASQAKLRANTATFLTA